jgi:hypothetical protein
MIKKIVLNYVTPKATTKLDISFNKLASKVCFSFFK